MRAALLTIVTLSIMVLAPGVVMAPGPPAPVPAPVPVSASGVAPSAVCTVGATTSSLGAVFSAAGPGAVVCLASGNYGMFSGGAKSGWVTIRPAAGASVRMGVAFGPSAQNIRIDGIQDFAGADLDGSRNIEIVNSAFTAPVQVRGASSGVVFDNDTFYGLSHGPWEGRLSFAQGGGNTIVRNSFFGRGGCSDGIQITGGGRNVTIEGNVFSGLRQGKCAEHVDPIQFYGAIDVKVLSNYFHDNSTGIMSPDGNGSPITVKNNVWIMDEYPWALVGGGTRNSSITHNVVVGGSLAVDTSNSGIRSTNTTIRDNVASLKTEGDGLTIDHNLLAGKVSFRGGTGRCAYALNATSAGRRAASDATDIGLNDCP